MTNCNNLGDLPEPPEPNKLTYNKVGGPIICQHPTFEGLVCKCQTFELSVVGGDCSGHLTYQWYKGLSGDDSNPLEGETSNVLHHEVVEDTSFWVRIKNPNLSCRDSEDVLIEVEPVTITILSQPQFVGELSCSGVDGDISITADTCIGTGGLTPPPSNELAELFINQPAFGDAAPFGFDIEIVYGDEFLVVTNADRQNLNADALLTALVAAIPDLFTNILVGYVSGALPMATVFPFADSPDLDSFLVEFINDLGLQNVDDIEIRAIKLGSHTGVARSGEPSFCLEHPLGVAIVQGSAAEVRDEDVLNDVDSICYQWYEGETGDISKPIVNNNADGSILTVSPEDPTSFWVRMRSQKCIDEGHVDEYVDSAHVTLIPTESINVLSGINPDWIQPDTANIFEIEVEGATPAYQWYKGGLIEEGDLTIIGQTYRVTFEGIVDPDYSLMGGPAVAETDDEFVATAEVALLAGQKLGDITTPLIDAPAGDSSNRVTSGSQEAIIEISPSQLQSSGIARLESLENPFFHPSGDTVPSAGLFEPLINGSYTSIGGIVINDAGVWNAGNSGTPDDAEQLDRFTTGNPSEHDFAPLILGQEIQNVSTLEILGEGDVPEKDTFYEVTLFGVGGYYYDLLAGTRFFGEGGQLNVGVFGNRIGIFITTTKIWVDVRNECNQQQRGVERLMSLPPILEAMFGDMILRPDEIGIRAMVVELTEQPRSDSVFIREMNNELTTTSGEQYIREFTSELVFFADEPEVI